MMPWLRSLRARTMLILAILLAIVLQTLLALLANSISSEALTPLPYTWYMLLLRTACYGAALWRFKQSNSSIAILLTALALYEYYLFTLYQSASEGLLW